VQICGLWHATVYLCCCLLVQNFTFNDAKQLSEAESRNQETERSSELVTAAMPPTPARDRESREPTSARDGESRESEETDWVTDRETKRGRERESERIERVRGATREKPRKSEDWNEEPGMAAWAIFWTLKIWVFFSKKKSSNEL